MLAAIWLASMGVSTASAALWPEQLGKYQRKSTAPVDVSAASRAQLNEDGLEAIERADYGSFQVTACQFKDPPAHSRRRWILPAETASASGTT